MCSRKLVSKKRCDFEEAISMTGFGIFNVYLFFTVGGFLMCVIVETMSMMFIVPAAKCDLDLTLSQQGLLSSISFFGVVASSFTWGFLADTRGRRNVLIASLLSSFVTSMVCSFVDTNWLFILLRFINGACIGGASSIVYAYVGEFHNDLLRPKVVSGVAIFVAVGNIYLPGMAWLVLPLEFTVNLDLIDLQFKPWRMLMILYAFPSFIFACMLCLLPESPKFLLNQGRREEALDILKTMYMFNKRASKETYAVSEILWDGIGSLKSKSFLKTLWRQTVPIVRRPLLFKTLGVSILQFGIFASTSGLIMWYPAVLNIMSRFVEQKPDDGLTLCKSIEWELSVNKTLLNEGAPKLCVDQVKVEVFTISLVIGVVYACMYLFIALLINVVGKKNLLCLFIIVGTTSGMISQYIQGYQVIQILMGVFIIGGAEVGIVNAIVVDLFPTQVRAMALAMSLMLGRFGAMVGTNVVGPLIFNWCNYLFYVFTFNHIVLLIIVYLLPSKKPLHKMTENDV